MLDLKSLIIQEIKLNGPMPLDRYMELCLSHPVHGYYMKKDPFGVKGDFITAPEISQIFGEMIAVWLISKWQELGSPQEIALIELGPGRGTLMSDILRTIKIAPEFKPEIHLVETSPVLTAIQKTKLPNAEWHTELPKLKIPGLIIANEFFDALPIKQFIGSNERKIICQGNKLAFNMIAEDGITDEEGALGLKIMKKISNYAGGIIIDYGYIHNQKKNTLQALQNHKYVSVLENPGDADITAHVDFGKLAQVSKKPCKIITQREFLLQHGADLRAKVLKKEADLDRLINPEQMGELFKVLCF